MSTDETLKLSDQWRAVIDCVDAFEESGGVAVADLRSFTSRVDPSHRAAALSELIKVDLERRWKAGSPKTVVQYLAEYPELGSESNPPADLLEFESELCRRHGGFPTEIQYDPSTKGGQRMPNNLAASAADSVPNDQINTIPFEAVHGGSGPAPGRPTHIGRYRIVEELGSGTFGAVYRCFDEELKRDVAIKLPHLAAADMVEEFLYEARAAARLRHPGIVAILDANRTEDGRGYIVFEFIPGKTLQAHFLAADFDRPRAVGWIADVADALHYAHKNNLVHRDIKPANILIDKAGGAKLTDFGLAKMDDQFFMDDAGRVLGTVAYMNPEQASGQAHWASPQSDIYSLGVVLYELLCGKRPFTAGSSLDLIQQVEKRPAAPPRTIDDSIPPPLEDICLKAMAKNPTERYNTAADMATALRAAIAPPVAKPAPNWLARIALGAVAAAALVAVALFAVQNLRPGPAPQPVVATAPVIELLSMPIQRRSLPHHMAGATAALGELDPPLAIDDRVQFFAEFDRDVYAYVIWYDDPKQPTLVWPPVDKLDSQQPVRRLVCPQGADGSIESKWLPVTWSNVPRFILIGVTESPISSGDLESFFAKPFELPPKLGEEGYVTESHPKRRADTPAPTALAQRGTSDDRGFRPPPAAVTSGKNALPDKLLQACRDRFAAFELIGLSELPTTPPPAK